MKSLKKNLIGWLLVLSATIMLFTSCGKDNNNDTNNSNNNPVTGISLDVSTLTLAVGKDYTLTATVTPGDAADKTVTWTSSDKTKATVVNGKVTAIAAGTTTITAKAGDKTATCMVTVNNQAITANMTGKINGGPFSWTGEAQMLGDALELKASGETFMPRIVLSIPSDVITGQSYSITLYGNYKALFVNSEGFNVTADNGSITITEYDKTKKTIKGTFHLSIPESLFTPSYSITDGSFSYVYEILF